MTAPHAKKGRADENRWLEISKAEYAVCKNCTLPDCMASSFKCALNGDRNIKRYNRYKHRRAVRRSGVAA